MLSLRRLRLIVPLAATTLLTLTVAPSAVAESVSPDPQISQVQEQHMERGVVTILSTITDIFSCEHHPALPWCS